MKILEVLPQMQPQDNAIQPAIAPRSDSAAGQSNEIAGPQKKIFKDVLAKGLKNDAAADKEAESVNVPGVVADIAVAQKETDADAVPEEATDGVIGAVDLISLWQVFIDMQVKSAKPEELTENASVEDVDALKECQEIIARIANKNKVSAEELNIVREFIAAKLGIQPEDLSALVSKFFIMGKNRMSSNEAADSSSRETPIVGPSLNTRGVSASNEANVPSAPPANAPLALLTNVPSAPPANALLAQSANVQPAAISNNKSAAPDQELLTKSAPALSAREAAPQNKASQENTFGFNMNSSHTPAAPLSKAPGLADAGKTAPSQFSAQLQERILDIKKLAQDVSLNIEKGGSRMNIHLKPESLGDVSIRAVMGSDGMRISFQTDNLQARQLMEASFPQLKEVLELRGIKVVDFTVGNEGQPSDQFEGSRRQSDSGAARHGQRFAEESNSLPEKKNKRMGRYTVDYLA